MTDYFFRAAHCFVSGTRYTVAGHVLPAWSWLSSIEPFDKVMIVIKSIWVGLLVEIKGRNEMRMRVNNRCGSFYTKRSRQSEFT
jgi:hypothetical protein